MSLKSCPVGIASFLVLGLFGSGCLGGNEPLFFASDLKVVSSEKEGTIAFYGIREGGRTVEAGQLTEVLSGIYKPAGPGGSSVLFEAPLDFVGLKLLDAAVSQGVLQLLLQDETSGELQLRTIAMSEFLALRAGDHGSARRPVMMSDPLLIEGKGQRMASMTVDGNGGVFVAEASSEGALHVHRFSNGNKSVRVLDGSPILSVAPVVTYAGDGADHELLVVAYPTMVKDLVHTGVHKISAHEAAHVVQQRAGSPLSVWAGYSGTGHVDIFDGMMLSTPQGEILVEGEGVATTSVTVPLDSCTAGAFAPGGESVALNVSSSNGVRLFVDGVPLEGDLRRYQAGEVVSADSSAVLADGTCAISADGNTVDVLWVERVDGSSGAYEQVHRGRIVLERDPVTKKVTTWTLEVRVNRVEMA